MYFLHGWTIAGSRAMLAIVALFVLVNAWYIEGIKFNRHAALCTCNIIKKGLVDVCYV